ncbi:MAG: Hydroxyacylglutathione hydrolase GloC [Opitutia bacterium UBA7350]|nr:MAG: Hydroxyacylglutathione hydrolase GloC [Opitutae bacterium UBA7350]
MLIPLEDNFEDVLMKAATGLGLSKSKLAAAAGRSVAEVTALLRGRFEPQALRQVASVLQLDGPALEALARGESAPEQIQVPGIYVFNTPFPIPGYAEMTVNSYLAVCMERNIAVAFDTGTDAIAMLEQLAAECLDLRAIFMTHTHRDHVAAVPTLKQAFPKAVVYSPRSEPFAGAMGVGEGDCFEYGSLKIEARLTKGHSKGGTSYQIKGAAFVGDALFAGSQGGVPAAHYALALEMNRAKLLSLPPETILCPGHGPLTTVAHELCWNPFYAQSN